MPLDHLGFTVADCRAFHAAALAVGGIEAVCHLPGEA